MKPKHKTKLADYNNYNQSPVYKFSQWPTLQCSLSQGSASVQSTHLTLPYTNHHPVPRLSAGGSANGASIKPRPHCPNADSMDSVTSPHQTRPCLWSDTACVSMLSSHHKYLPCDQPVAWDTFGQCRFSIIICCYRHTHYRFLLMELSWYFCFTS